MNWIFKFQVNRSYNASCRIFLNPLLRNFILASASSILLKILVCMYSYLYFCTTMVKSHIKWIFSRFYSWSSNKFPVADLKTHLFHLFLFFIFFLRRISSLLRGSSNKCALLYMSCGSTSVVVVVVVMVIVVEWVSFFLKNL